MKDETIMWEGASGKQYEYWISPISMSFVDEPGNYIFVRETSPNKWIPLYIGQTESLKNRLADHEKLLRVIRNGEPTSMPTRHLSVNRTERKRKQIFWPDGTLPVTRNDLVRATVFISFTFWGKSVGCLSGIGRIEGEFEKDLEPTSPLF